MAKMEKIAPRELYVGRLTHGRDLLEELTEICRAKNIRLGRIEALGAVQKARLGFYNQHTFEYEFLALDEPLEITCLIGNISLKSGEPFVHAHVTLADGKGRAYGGHLAPGAPVFACEFIIEAFDGPDLERNPDGETGLPLWTMPG